MPLSNELKEIYQSAPIDSAIVETLEFSHSEFATQYIINWHTSITTKAGTFIPLAFEAILPKRDASGRQDFQIGIDATLPEPVMFVKKAVTNKPNELIKVTYRLYNSKTVSAASDPLDDPVVMEVASVDYGDQQMVFTIAAPDLVNQLFPRKRYRPDRFPGLVR